VGLDRAEDGDSIRRAPGPTAGDSGAVAVLADPERRAAIGRLYHALVDHTYGVARDAWAQVLPGLHAAWQKHAEKYPERDRPAPRTQPDGSWVADAVRKLTPEQNAEVDRGVARIREVGKDVIVPGIRAVEAEDPTRCLAGFEHCFKRDDRLKEKVADQLKPPSELTAPEALSTIADTVRFTFCYQETSYANGARTDVELLKAHGFELMKLKNTWTGDQYKGINSQWRERESGVRFEVQFHTPASLEAKELSHDAYERLRGTEAQDDEREELEAFQSAVNAKLPIPPDVTTIKDYPQEKRDG
jgi:hypothetical protein